jgi:hypothetical protein
MGLKLRISRYRILLTTGVLSLWLLLSPAISAGKASSEGGMNEPFRKDQWENLRKGVDYTEKPVRPQNNVLKPPKTITLLSREVLIVFMVLIILGMVTFLISRNLEGRNIPKKKTTKDIAPNDEEPDESMLFNEYEKAISESDFRLALRCFYILLLRKLADNGLIVLLKDKTNQTYKRELRNSDYFQPFSGITGSVEAAWFGARAISQEDFIKLTGPFNDLVVRNKINRR